MNLLLSLLAQHAFECAQNFLLILLSQHISELSHLTALLGATNELFTHDSKLDSIDVAGELNVARNDLVYRLI